MGAPTNPVPSEWYAAGEAVLRTVVSEWRRLLIFGIVGALVALGITFVLPKYYRSGAAFQAESTAPVGLSGSLSALSSLAGVQVGGGSNPLLLGDLLTTDAVLRRVILVRFPWHGDSAQLAQIYGYDGKPALERDYRTVDKLRKAISVDVDIRTGVVRFTVEANGASLSQSMAEALVAALDQANVELRQQRARAEKEFVGARSDDARRDLAVAESTLAAFDTQNRIIRGSPTLELEEARLRRRVDLAQQLYIQLQLQEEQAALQELRATPAVGVIDPPLEPVKPSWPKKKVAVVGGFLIGLGLVLLRRLWIDWKNRGATS